MLLVAFSTGDGSEWRSPMTVVAIGGLPSSTALTLIVVPVAYTLVGDAQRALAGAVARMLGRSVAAAGGEK